MHIRPRLTASIAALTLALLAAPPVIAAPVQSEAPAGATTCAFSAWANYDKPSITVRDAPSASAKALGQIPARPAAGEPEYSYSVTFDVKEAKDGWLRIANASDAYNEDEYPERAPRKVYKGEGWIRADDARVGIQSARGYAAGRRQPAPGGPGQRLADRNGQDPGHPRLPRGLGAAGLPGGPQALAAG
ncbi:hypothetical protein WJ967_17135 [Achromobacter xylosoxidans]